LKTIDSLHGEVTGQTAIQQVAILLNLVACQPGGGEKKCFVAKNNFIKTVMSSDPNSTWE